MIETQGFRTFWYDCYQIWGRNAFWNSVMSKDEIIKNLNCPGKLHLPPLRLIIPLHLLSQGSFIFYNLYVHSLPSPIIIYSALCLHGITFSITWTSCTPIRICPRSHFPLIYFIGTLSITLHTMPFTLCTFPSFTLFLFSSINALSSLLVDLF